MRRGGNAATAGRWRIEGAASAAALVLACGTRSGLVEFDDAVTVANGDGGAVSDGGGGRDSGPVDAGRCLAESAACRLPSDCCSQRCFDGVCGRPLCSPGAPPALIAGGLDAPAFMTTDESIVYFAEGRNVRRVPVDGASSTEVLYAAPSGSRVRGVAVDSTYVYFTYALGSGGGVGRLRKDRAGAPEVRPVADGSPREVVPAGRGVVFTADAPSGFVDHEPFDAPRRRLAGGQTNAFTAAVVGDDVYWPVADTSTIPAQSHIRTVRFSAPGAARDLGALAPGPFANVWALAVDATHLYVTAAGGLQRMPRSGGTVQSLSQPVSVVGGVALDGNTVYFAADNGRALHKMAKTGGAAQVVAAGLRAARAVRVVATCVVWVDSSEPGQPTGRILRVQK